MFQEFTWPLCEGWTVGGKTGFECVVVRNGNNLGEGGSSEEGKKWSESNCPLEIELTELVDGLELGCDLKRGIKEDTWFSGLSN